MSKQHSPVVYDGHEKCEEAEINSSVAILSNK